MKVYFIGSDRRDPQNVESYKKIADVIESLNVQLDRSYVDATTEEDRANFEVAYKRNIKAIKNSDLLVAEVSDMSSGVGFLIANALSQKKPVLALYKKDKKENLSATILGSDVSNKLLFYEEYAEDNLKEKLQKFFEETKNLLDTKFILIIPPEIDRYLEWASDYKRMHKAQIVREAIDQLMEEDEEWQNREEV
ncbi:hypothetical protein GF362_07095 [Candidatus Dojkabacteria bacterium]|nr:hypothetical protein [Candidatus Dojkabacteria bacterium]